MVNTHMAHNDCEWHCHGANHGAATDADVSLDGDDPEVCEPGGT